MLSFPLIMWECPERTYWTDTVMWRPMGSSPQRLRGVCVCIFPLSSVILSLFFLNILPLKFFSTFCSSQSLFPHFPSPFSYFSYFPNVPQIPSQYLPVISSLRLTQTHTSDVRYFLAAFVVASWLWPTSFCPGGSALPVCAWAAPRLPSPLPCVMLLHVSLLVSPAWNVLIITSILSLSPPSPSYFLSSFPPLLLPAFIFWQIICSFNSFLPPQVLQGSPTCPSSSISFNSVPFCLSSPAPMLLTLVLTMWRFVLLVVLFLLDTV